MTPTRNQNILDLVLTNEPFIAENITVSEPFFECDHNQIHIELNETKKLNHNPEIKWRNFYIANYMEMNKQLANFYWHDWFSLCANLQ